MRPLNSWSLAGLVILASVIVTAVTEMRIAGMGSVALSAGVAYAGFFANVACSGLGFSTPERGWWIANVAIGIATMTFLGAPTIPSALWTAGRVLLARALA
ncbi:hypothetical protein RPMA_15415 [Tardiphaga alba]|uniref:Uncharacterized protein n=1 Tax=Tardiphaga alba TaxID=340268 RepID=A0ABX8A8R7_9BRAD|nr:hypothetical protein [Tardiphaga alba]QUS40063.1 hypothetical protein RPMA_15415 [Tardiphaga alba]